MSCSGNYEKPNNAQGSAETNYAHASYNLGISLPEFVIFRLSTTVFSCCYTSVIRTL